MSPHVIPSRSFMITATISGLLFKKRHGELCPIPSHYIFSSSVTDCDFPLRKRWSGRSTQKKLNSTSSDVSALSSLDVKVWQWSVCPAASSERHSTLCWLAVVGWTCLMELRSSNSLSLKWWSFSGTPSITSCSAFLSLSSGTDMSCGRDWVTAGVNLISILLGWGNQSTHWPPGRVCVWARARWLTGGVDGISSPSLETTTLYCLCTLIQLPVSPAWAAAGRWSGDSEYPAGGIV